MRAGAGGADCCCFLQVVEEAAAEALGELQDLKDEVTAHREARQAAEQQVGGWGTEDCITLHTILPLCEPSENYSNNRRSGLSIVMRSAVITAADVMPRAVSCNCRKGRAFLAAFGAVQLPVGARAAHSEPWHAGRQGTGAAVLLHSISTLPQPLCHLQSEITHTCFCMCLCWL